MYSEKLMQSLEERKKIYHAIWLMVPIQVLIITFVCSIILKTTKIQPVIKVEGFFLVVAVAFVLSAALLVAIGIFMRSKAFKVRLELSATEDEQGSDSAETDADRLSENDNQILNAYNKIFAQMVILCALFEAPVLIGMILAILSAKSVFVIAGGVVSMILWKVYIPSASVFKAEFLLMLSNQVGKS
ncbi:MAG: hypothetical protein Kow0029_00560 [Candidatus Rifleibacteriota bacterium]